MMFQEKVYWFSCGAALVSGAYSDWLGAIMIMTTALAIKFICTACKDFGIIP